MTAPTVVILAAGQGTRMRSALPKVLHPLCGRPLVHWPIHAARAAGAGRIVVVDSAARPLDGHLPEDVLLAVQERPDGTAGALEAAAADFPEDGAVIVLSGDVPLVTRGVRRRAHRGPRGERRGRHDGDDAARRPGRLRAGPARRRGRGDGRRRGQGRRRRDRRAARDPRGQHRDLRLRRPRAARGAAADRLRQRAGRALPARRPAAAARRRPHRSRPTSSPTRRSRSASTTAPTSPPSGRSPRRASTTGSCARA